MQIPLFGLGIQGRSLNLSAMRRVNLYLEVDQDGDKSRITAFGMPGRDLFVSLGDTPVRGMHAIGDFLYVVHRGMFYEINNAMQVTARGTLTTTAGAVSIADNGVEIFIADGVTKGWVYNLSTLAFTAVSSANAVISDSVTFLDAKFIVNKVGTGEFHFSDGYAGLTWQALSFATAEASPDKLVAVIAERGLLGLFGEFTMEVWSGVDTSPVPFARVQGITQEWGLAARDSLRKFDNALIFLGRNRLGELSVLTGSGGSQVRASTPELDSVINGYPSPGDAVGGTFMLNGHPMYQLSFGSAAKTWLYDGKSGAWSELQSFGATRDRGHLFVQHLGRTRVSDFSNGNIYTMNSSVFTDNGAAIECELVSGHIYAADYNTLAMHELRLDMETGIGLATGQGSNPQVMLSISRDGGHTYGIERWKPAGALGNYRKRVTWRRLTVTRDTVFKVRMTDPVKRVFLGASLYGTAGKA